MLIEKYLFSFEFKHGETVPEDPEFGITAVLAVLYDQFVKREGFARKCYAVRCAVQGFTGNGECQIVT